MNQNQPPSYYDPDAHEAGCKDTGAGRGVTDPGQYFDVFCDCHRYTEPKILSNGTDIAWPAGWEPAQAMAWRRANGLAQPTDASAQ